MSMGPGLKLGKLWRRKTWTGWEEEEEVVAGPVAVDTEAAMEARAMVMVEAMAARVAMVGVMAAMEAAMVMVVVTVAIRNRALRVQLLANCNGAPSVARIEAHARTAVVIAMAVSS